MKNVCIVIPVYNEGPAVVDNLREIMRWTQACTGARLSLLVVDDGSSDGLRERLARSFRLGEELHYLRLRRNFGKEAAICAGLEQARHCDAVIVMDSDLQHPPSLLPALLAAWQQGHEVVEARKRKRGEEGLLNRLGARLFYRIFNAASGIDLAGMTDFKLLDRSIVELYLQLPERSRFFRGLIQWINCDCSVIDFDVPATGKQGSSWSAFGLARYALRSITSFSALPMQLVTLCGALTLLLSVVIGGISIHDKLTGEALDGFTTVILLILIIGSILMLSLGLIGIYLARIFDEVKRRPAWLADERNSRVDLQPGD